MQTGVKVLWEKTEYSYPTFGEFIPNVHYYLHDEDDTDRPAILVVPGGAYRMVSCTEGEIVALEFYRKGYNTFVVTYTTNISDQMPLKLQPLMDLSAAVTYVRENAQMLHVIPNQIVVCGFSAGAHLTGSLAVHHDDQALKTVSGGKCGNNRPDAVILSYPVITSGEYAHRDSFVALLGKDATEAELAYMSLENHVTADTPPCFLWQTATDVEVPVRNSYLFANACKENGVAFEHHVFCEGPHGMSLANEDWAKGNYEGYYTMDQTIELFQYMVDHDIPLPPPFDALKLPKGTKLKDLAGATMKQFTPEQTPDSAVAMWSTLADIWLKRVFG